MIYFQNNQNLNNLICVYTIQLICGTPRNRNTPVVAHYNQIARVIYKS